MSPLESGWMQIILQEVGKAGLGELAKFGWRKFLQLLKQIDAKDPTEGTGSSEGKDLSDEWVPIGTRVFAGPRLDLVVMDVEEVPPLLEQAALTASRAESTKQNRGYFEVKVTGKFHEYWAVGLPWIPDVDPADIAREPYELPEDVLHATGQRAAILYYSRVAGAGEPYQNVLLTARKLLR